MKPKNGNGKGGNRHSLDIVRDILSVASVRTRKTRIMYQANLSFVQVEKYLYRLLERGLVDHDGDSTYLITRRGLDFLKLYEQYVDGLKQIEVQVDRSERARLFLEGMCNGCDPYDVSKAVRKTAFSEGWSNGRDE